jgi:uncharacterized protein with GYD domain
MSLIPGIDRLTATLDAQNIATAQHREWEGKTLHDITTRIKETRAFAEETNGKINQAAIDIAVIQEAERQAAIIQAAKLKAEEDAKNRKVSWQQGIVFAISGAAMTGVLGTLGLWLAHVL